MTATEAQEIREQANEIHTTEAVLRRMIREGVQGWVTSDKRIVADADLDIVATDLAQHLFGNMSMGLRFFQ